MSTARVLAGRTLVGVRVVKKLGFADALGIVASLVALAWLPGAADPLTNVKLLVLAAGGLAVAPAVALRWKGLIRSRELVLIPVLALVALLAWAVISTVASGAPFWNSVFGWWGRGDGLLAWIGAAFLLLGGASLSPREVGRTISWLLGGASLVALIGLLQDAGADIPQGAVGQVSGTMGNTNFAAGYFAILASLALGRALTQAVLWQRIWGGALFVVLAFLSWATGALQGPAALVAGLVGFGLAYALLYRGRLRLLGLVSASGVVLVGLVLLVLSFVGTGPLARLWAQQTFEIRQQYWQSAMNIMAGRPLFGTGPDGFSRYVAEFRPESYVELLGPVLRVSAAHNIALQFGAVLGYLGLFLWIIVFIGTGFLLLARCARRPVVSIGTTASVAGAFTAYVVQGMVSIDMLPLLATGWLVTGLALASARELEPSDRVEPPLRKSRKDGGAPERQIPVTPVWVPAVGATLAIVPIVLVGSQVSLTNEVQSISSQEQALNFISNPMTPCVLRVQVTQQVIQQLPADASVPATIEATNLDRRCPPMINFASDVLTQQGRFEEAATFTADGVEFDPLFDLAWVLCGRYFLGVGDLESAEEAALEARRVQEVSGGRGDPALVDSLLQDIETARSGE